MFNGDCYPNGSYIDHIYITQGHTNYSPLQCVLPDSTLSGGQWIYPNGQPVNCNSNNNTDPLRCIESNNPANITVYRPSGQDFYEYASNFNTDNIGGICSSVVYPVIVLILLPTSSLFIYSVSYISLY